jgi:threonylcarbamoyladenosine tRNA methylthiotransferase MtaB
METVLLQYSGDPIFHVLEGVEWVTRCSEWAISAAKLGVMSVVHIENFGCRAARADGEAIGGQLRVIAALEPLATDVVVVNTCSVTAEADRAARAYIRRTHRQNPSARIVVTGCYAQRAPQELAAIPGVSAVIGNSHKALASTIIQKLARSEREASPIPLALVPVGSLLANRDRHSVPVWADDRFAHSFIEDAPLAPGAQTRPNLKIQEGCSNRCTFCVIPFTRGPSKSLPHAVVLHKVEDFVAAGGNELVLSGINLGRWGRDLADSGSRSLAELVRLIFDRTSLQRLRLSSIEPMDWDEQMIDLMHKFGGNRLAPHAHLPLQSGSDSVLRRMHRRYRPWHYAGRVTELLRAAGPHLTLGADVMVGFPGESDAEFEETLNFIGTQPFGYLHLFPFSPRPGTPGWALHAANPVPAAVIEERMAILRTLAQEKSHAHRSRFIGRELSIITLQTGASLASLGRTAGLSDNFLRIELEGQFPANLLLTVRVTGLNSEGELTATCSL